MRRGKWFAGCVASLLTALCLLPCSAAAVDVTEGRADGLTDGLDAVVRSYSRNCAVQLQTYDGDTIYSHNPELILSGASVIKLPYAVYACGQIEEGVHTLDETMTYTKEWYHGGSGIIRKNGYGKVYTIRQLLDYSLRYSDNVAYDMLVELFGIDGFNETIAAWGYDVSIGTPSPRFPGLYADFVTDSMRRMQEHCHDSESWEVCWTALLESEDIIVRDYYPEETVLAVKYGEVSSVHHEVCYVDGEIPYILTIMTATAYDNPDEAFFGKIVDQVTQLLPAYAETAPDPGDVDYSRSVNASDASRVLIAAAKFGADGELGLSGRQQIAGDVNRDGEVNASDAALILQYAAVSGAGSEIAAADYFGLVEDE
ncbi:MAG: serine hydrolase [Oscillospiraceae bacterium]|nr:serine hydrolase [Oscillospiraceae bacterium]